MVTIRLSDDEMSRLANIVASVASDGSGADAESSDAERSGDPSVAGDSRVRVSDNFAWIDDPHLQWIPIANARHLLAELRQLEQRIQVTDGQ